MCSEAASCDSFEDCLLDHRARRTFRMEFSQEDLQHLSAAQGYIGLKMYLEANEELERVSPENRTSPQVLMLRVEIYRGLEKWYLMQVVAKRMAHGDPNNPQW